MLGGNDSLPVIPALENKDSVSLEQARLVRPVMLVDSGFAERSYLSE